MKYSSICQYFQQLVTLVWSPAVYTTQHSSSGRCTATLQCLCSHANVCVFCLSMDLKPIDRTQVCLFVCLQCLQPCKELWETRRALSPKTCEVSLSTEILPCVSADCRLLQPWRKGYLRRMFLWLKSRQINTILLRRAYACMRRISTRPWSHAPQSKHVWGFLCVRRVQIEAETEWLSEFHCDFMALSSRVPRVERRDYVSLSGDQHVIEAKQIRAVFTSRPLFFTASATTVNILLKFSDHYLSKALI